VCGRSVGLKSRLHNPVVWLVAALCAGGCEHSPPTAARIETCRAVACQGGLEDRVSLADGLKSLRFLTYEGSGQAMHPDVALTPRGWSTYQRHLVLTPYPFGNQASENPSMFAGDDGLTWTVEAGVTNPVARPDAGYLSDPALVYVPEASELWMYYRQASDQNYVWLVRSADGVTWGPATKVAQAPNHWLVSPTVVHRAPGDWQMWSVNGRTGCGDPDGWVERRTSADGRVWSDPVRVNLTQPGYRPWHVDVMWIASLKQYWALYNAKDAANCATPALFLATSDNGLDWTTYPSPVLERGASPEFADIVYRSAMEYLPQADAVRFWFSGARLEGGRYSWHIATQRRDRERLFRQIQAPAPAVPPAQARTVRLPAPERP
jgi:hypothetical protein